MQTTLPGFPHAHAELQGGQQGGAILLPPGCHIHPMFFTLYNISAAPKPSQIPSPAPGSCSAFGDSPYPPQVPAEIPACSHHTATAVGKPELECSPPCSPVSVPLPLVPKGESHFQNIQSIQRQHHLKPQQHDSVPTVLPAAPSQHQRIHPCGAAHPTDGTAGSDRYPRSL